jgi:predicted CXXCH cytochrome family protein
VRSPRLLLLALLAGVLALLGTLTPAMAVPPAAAPSASASGGLSTRSLPSPIDATNTCATCHGTLTDNKLRTPSKEFLHSTHRDERIGCVGCHKGDPRDPTVGAHSPTTGFTPHPTHAEVPQICGGCHSDAAFVRRVNGRLPVGQAALFNLSLHGKLTAAGDPAAPDCSTCHGKHDIQSPSSPLSPVNRANVAKLCSGCHADKERMGKYDIRTDQFEKWQKSVHGQAFAAGNKNAPTCTGCHGAHASTPPDASSVARACGRCHEQEMQLFEQSPHSQGFRKRGLAQCVACHSNHDVARASAIMVGVGPDATCMKCHSHDEKPRQVASDISDLLTGARERAAEARAAVARAEAAGLRVSGAQYSLDQVATAEQKVRGVVHTLDPSRVQAMVADIDSSVDETLRLVANAERARKLERRGYYAALVLSGLLLLTLVLKATRLDRRRRQASP